MRHRIRVGATEIRPVPDAARHLAAPVLNEHLEDRVVGKQEMAEHDIGETVEDETIGKVEVSRTHAEWALNCDDANPVLNHMA